MRNAVRPIREMDGRRDAGRHAGSRNERATGAPHQYITLKADVLRGRRGGGQGCTPGRLSESVTGTRLASWSCFDQLHRHQGIARLLDNFTQPSEKPSSVNRLQFGCTREHEFAFTRPAGTAVEGIPESLKTRPEAFGPFRLHRTNVSLPEFCFRGDPVAVDHLYQVLVHVLARCQRLSDGNPASGSQRRTQG
jgi:hypothetical protein